MSQAKSDDVWFEVPLDGSFVMQLRRSELESVAERLGGLEASDQSNPITLAEALRRMPTNDRAPVWELAMRRFGRHKPLKQAAGEIGMDLIHARDRLEQFSRLLALVPPPEHTTTL
jgi:hypothetical protein